jgi:arylsulfatase A-like enzyme
MDHGNSLYLASIHVPLMLWLPGTIPEGRRISTPVTTRDLPATILALVAPDDREALAGHSLVPLWADSATTIGPDSLLSEVNYASGLPDRYPISSGRMRSLLLDGMRLIENGEENRELYDFRLDQDELHDLAPQDTATVARLSRVLEQLTAPPVHSTTTP